MVGVTRRRASVIGMTWRRPSMIRVTRRGTALEAGGSRRWTRRRPRGDVLHERLLDDGTSGYTDGLRYGWRHELVGGHVR